jgi:hypothetical protein
VHIDTPAEVWLAEVIQGYPAHAPPPPPQGPYGWSMPRVLGGSKEGGRFLMSEVPLYIIISAEVWRAEVIVARSGDKSHVGIAGVTLHSHVH